MTTFTQDGCDFTLKSIDTQDGTTSEVFDSDGLIGTFEIDHNLETISYDKDGDEGTLNYWEFCAADKAELFVAEWIAGTYY